MTTRIPTDDDVNGAESTTPPPTRTTGRRRRTLTTFGALAGAGLLALGAASAPAAVATPADDAAAFAETVTAEAVTGHLQRFQEIADANGGNRAVGTSGYEASAAYVEETLAGAGYTTERQYFETLSQTIASSSLVIAGVDPAIEAIPMSYTPGTDPAGVTGPLVAPADPLGCSADAWTGVDAAGAIALVSRGTCSFSEKSAAAGAAGALGVIVYNNAADTAEPLNGTLGAPDDAYVPSFGITATEGASLLALVAAGETPATLAIDETTELLTSFNVIAETATGRDDNVVMLGAHLDSVPEGPGINDNASGSAAILETAVQLAEAGPLNNAVRFAWWGAEEIGLVGSTEYVAALSEEEAAEIATYLNFDMVGSPNYVIAVYDADESTYPAPVEVPEGSIASEAVFTDYFDSIGQPWVDSEFSGRSDYQAFIDAGIASSGIDTGADGTKTEEEVALFGGTAGIIHDPNYHTVADDITNIDPTALGITTKAIAFAAASLAADTSAVNGVVPPTSEPTATPTPTAEPTEEPTATPTAEPTATPTAEPTTTATAVPVPTSTSTTGTASGSLANTGADPALPLGAAAALVLGGGIAIALAERRRRLAVAEAQQR